MRNVLRFLGLLGLIAGVRWLAGALLPHPVGMSTAQFTEIAAALAPELIKLLAGGGQTQQVSGLEPSDVWTRTQGRLLPAGETERGLSTNQANLARIAFGAGSEALPAGLSLANLASGEISPTSRARIHQAAFAPVQEGLRMASRQAEEEALSRGIPLSSIQFGREAELTRPLIAGAAGTEAQLGLAEMNRLEGLRQNALGNMLALQQSPALDRLLQIRMAEAEKTNLQLSRAPGGLPEGAYTGNQPSDTEKEQAAGTKEEQQRQQRQTFYNNQVDPLVQRYRALFDEQRRINEAYARRNSPAGRRRLEGLMDENRRQVSAIEAEITRMWPGFDFDRARSGFAQLEA